jgi:hypothetical protein
MKLTLRNACILTLLIFAFLLNINVVLDNLSDTGSGRKSYLKVESVYRVLADNFSGSGPRSGSGSNSGSGSGSCYTSSSVPCPPGVNAVTTGSQVHYADGTAGWVGGFNPTVTQNSSGQWVVGGNTVIPNMSAGQSYSYDRSGGNSMYPNSTHVTVTARSKTTCTARGSGSCRESDCDGLELADYPCYN